MNSPLHLTVDSCKTYQQELQGLRSVLQTAIEEARDTDPQNVAILREIATLEDSISNKFDLLTRNLGSRANRAGA